MVRWFCHDAGMEWLSALWLKFQQATDPIKVGVIAGLLVVEAVRSLFKR